MTSQRHSLSSSGFPSAVALADGQSVDCSGWEGAWPVDCWSPRLVRAGGQSYRLYALGPAAWEELAAAVRARALVALAILAPIEIVEVGAGALVAATALPDAGPALPAPPAGNDELEHLAGLLDACRALGGVLSSLHAAGFTWPNFDPECLEWAGERTCITNLDLCAPRAGERAVPLPFSAAYAPPETCGPATDVFHLSAYAYYRLAGLLPRGFPGRGLPAFDFDFPPLRIYRPCLPVGIAPIFERGLARDPARRHLSVAELLSALEGAVTRARQRQASTVALAWDVGGATATGRAKEPLGRPNQDAFAVAEGPLVVVADGVSQSRVGSGDLASRTACSVLSGLAARLGAANEEETADALRAACLEASRAIVRQAQALGPLPRGARPEGSMSSTALVGAFREHAVSLANVGDSRAYLIAEGGVEQLTVDGDVRCVQLARGAAPEAVRALGADGQLLHSALGACERAPFGDLRASVERSAPHVAHWPLLPGDVVLFCTDGLIEEGAFLSAEEAAAVVRAAPDAPAWALAERLVALADERQRLPSPEEPAGHGDNITCVVVKASAT